MKDSAHNNDNRSGTALSPMKVSVLLSLAVAFAAAFAAASSGKGKEGEIIVFVDMDGVLAPWLKDPESWVDDDESNDPLVNVCYNKVPDRTLDALSHLLGELPSKKGGRTKLVLSSAWRYEPKCVELALDYIKAYVEKHPSSPLREHTTRFSALVGSEGDNRQEEIVHWFHHHENHHGGTKIEAWVALDDLVSVKNDEAYKDMLKDHCVITDEYVGLTMKDAKKAVQLIKKQLDEDTV